MIREVEAPSPVPAAATPTDPFGVEGLAALFAEMARFDVTELQLRRGGDFVHVRRGVTVEPGPEPSGPSSSLAIANGTVGGGLTVRTPVAGVLHFREPGANGPLVSAGAPVRPDSIVALVLDAGGTLNEILAECSGKIRRVLAAEGSQVSAGAVLLEVEAA